MRTLVQFGNIENTAQHGRPRLLGYAASGCVFNVRIAPRAPSERRWVARPVTPRDDVNEFRGPSLASISNQLSVL